MSFRVANQAAGATPSTLTDLTVTNNLTLSGGTANGVLFLNGSKVATSGSALTFDGSKLTVSATSGETGLLTATGVSNYLSIKGDTGGTTIWNGIGTDTGVAWVGSVSNHSVSFRQNNTEQMRLTSTGLGIGTSSPSVRLQTNATINTAYSSSNTLAGGVIAYIKNASTTNSTDATIRLEATGSGNIAAASISALHTSSGFSALTFGTRADADVTERMRIDSSGNLGLGVTPSATQALYRSMELFGSIWMGGNGTAPATYSMTNNYYDGSFKYKTTGYAATYYAQQSGQHQWYIAPSGTAGNVISFTQAMTLDASGNLGIGTTSPAVKLHVKSGNGSQIIADNAGEVYSGFDIYNNGTRKAFVQNHNTNNLLYVGSDTGGIAFYTNNTERARITSTGNVVAGGSVALATTATDGFLYVPTCAGTPTGTPTAITGMAPIVVDTTNNKMYFYSGGAWRDAGP